MSEQEQHSEEMSEDNLSSVNIESESQETEQVESENDDVNNTNQTEPPVITIQSENDIVEAIGENEVTGDEIAQEDSVDEENKSIGGSQVVNANETLGHTNLTSEEHETGESTDRQNAQQLDANNTIFSVSSAMSTSTRSTLALVKNVFEDILEAKDLKKHPNCQKVIERAVTRIQESQKDASAASQVIDSILIFEALRAACRTKSSRMQVKVLDCLSKLFSFRALDESILINPPDALASIDQVQEDSAAGITPPPKQKLIDAAIDTIADCFQGEGTDDRVELQIIRSLSSCILVEDSISLCHGVSLLKAVRTIYNIFVFSLNASNQGIAQATLAQIIGSVFDRVNVRTLSSSTKVNEPIEGSLNNGGTNPVTLENMKNLNDEEERRVDAQENDNSLEQEDEISSGDDLAIKDAFLVFRAMAKICAKPLEAELDMRSHAVRSKLLSLHIIYSIVRDHVDVLASSNLYLPGQEKTTLLDSIRQYLCLSLSRNAASPISPVFEITLEIMWLLIANLRAEFMREIPVFLTEIYFPVAELKTATSQQKRYFLTVIQRICNDPRTLIEFYLNYDCNPGMPNIMEIMVDYLTRLALTRVDITPSQRSYYEDQKGKPLATFNLNQLPLLTTSNLSSNSDSSQVVLPFPVDFALKTTSLSCIVSVLRSLSSWAHKALNTASVVNSSSKPRRSSQSMSISSGTNDRGASLNGDSSFANDDETRSNLSQSQDYDDPSQFESLKQRKTQLSDYINLFNTKPKKALPLLVSKGFLKDDSPTSIAKWLLETEGLDLATVGDFLGEGDAHNIAVMHAFVDEMDFKDLSIVDALREFLQKFRLPGEGQKIDRFMLKFAERFVEQNPGVFSKADTAYALSYSLIMLNTDLHSSQIKNKMTLQEFLENNEGIDNDKDLPRDFMVGLFDEIANDEIKLLSEQHQAMLSGDDTLQSQQPSAFSFFSSRDLAREAYMQVSKEISSKTELVFKNLSKAKTDSDVYYAASHVEHVKSIFENLWMSFLAALTPPFKEYDDLETSSRCLEGLKLSIKISATFGIDDCRQSFIGALVQFCNLQNLEEIKLKNINAMIDLLEVALSEGNYIKESWKDILLVVSQMERLQLISKGIDRETVPDVAQARLANPRVSYDSNKSNAYFFDIWSKKATPIEVAQEKHHNQVLSPEISKYISSTELVVLMDNIFTKSAELSGSAIVDFIKALTKVSLDEIESSQNASTPRMFSLQKMIDVCYYNMDRIRLEWSPVWAVMGGAFNKIATNENLAVVFFAIDSLRQLSMRFLDIEELVGFEFQHDFLKPFEYTVQNTSSVEVQEMIIECFKNFILTKSSRIKSGWKPILESLQYTAQSTNESIVAKTQKLVSHDITVNHFESVFQQEGSFSELVNVFKEITKYKKSQKLALHALESLKHITQNIADICFAPSDAADYEHKKSLLRGKDVFQDIWFPMLYCFNETIMTAEDLEVRSRALNYMFDALVAYGKEFDETFWANICNKLLFPIFSVLSKHWEVNQFNSHDDLSVWLSTTLIQALRNLVALFTHYFESLNSMLDGFLDLLVSCICQENDTIARIGRSCLQQLILQNVNKFNDEHWRQLGRVFNKLFESTTATELFDYDPLHQGRKPSITQESSHSNADVHETVQRAHEEEASEDVGNEFAATYENNTTSVDSLKNARKSPLNVNKNGGDARRRLNVKNSIVVKCVLQLLMIELLSELFENEEFTRYLPYTEALIMLGLLEKSYEFSHDFNEDYGLRTRLVEARVVDKIPNLLKQETSAAAVLIDVMFKLYLNDEEKKSDLLTRLVTICMQVVKSYTLLDDRTMERSINSWRPVIVEILQGYYEFDDDDFRQHCAFMYNLVIQLLDKSVPSDLRHATKLFLSRVGELYLSTAE
ncbi:hypothetical protein KAFR_0B05990 [Kazachstania africana CBS 2517]|uniref:SEC7 domain-containing protein n=1 Tax=Kazachstania africana (strain ATCC 22294 / BCRC 22015 / CBS 2517 / CECT 1963 / NBRC 1671 / NRRL Y-8276) TaxID=1071382 RepID=H2AR95_KAZAF|nr:hypothetical protein KAFR_0B05990 [Kazachstania africana CBS 2517]CCF56895.1 hypothetical protein KAFR_0B05990 [Kazachstania africana CBS 2517]